MSGEGHPSPRVHVRLSFEHAHTRQFIDNQEKDTVFFSTVICQSQNILDSRFFKCKNRNVANKENYSESHFQAFIGSNLRPGIQLPG